MTAEPIDGVIKYQARHTAGDIEAYLHTLPTGTRDAALNTLRLFPELDAARTALHDAGLIGVYPSGIGYGNISLRLAGKLFLISGSGTGASRILGRQGYSLVCAFDPHKNAVASLGPVQASSESMTHGAIYDAASEAQCVIHIHSPFLFASLLAKGFPRTPDAVAYGTPALSREVARLIAEELPPSGGVFVTAGHNEGVFAYGESIASTLKAILSLNATKD
ncbi:class II aldolase/adducin family protein [uncultured Bilophila sp.]|uniref:class II aldolase/adducin family protein n=1 Tax=uncultured Bilophila sp. TaxID=529385 RepID=UPI00280BF22C|nr:class II aldolase/adducin family protein [uncultured Bilophila sp.]